MLKLGVFVEGLKKIACRSAEDIEKLIDDGTQVRTIASTQMNATSSRSHAILSLSIRVKSTETETASTLHLVDLAGSERAEATGDWWLAARCWVATNTLFIHSFLYTRSDSHKIVHHTSSALRHTRVDSNKHRVVSTESSLAARRLRTPRRHQR